MKAIVRKTFDRFFGEQNLVYEERPRELVEKAGITPGLHDFIYLHEKGHPEKVVNGLVVWVNQTYGNVAINDQTLRSLRGENPWAIISVNAASREIKYIWAKDISVKKPWVTTMTVPGERAENGELGELLLLRLDLSKTPWEPWPLFKPTQLALPFGTPSVPEDESQVIDHPWHFIDEFLNPRKMVSGSSLHTLMEKMNKEKLEYFELKKIAGLWRMRAR